MIQDAQQQTVFQILGYGAICQNAAYRDFAFNVSFYHFSVTASLSVYFS